MNSNTNIFQWIVLGVFFALAVGGIIFFAVFRGFGSEPNPYGERVVIWGTLDDAPFTEVMEILGNEDPNFKVVSYVQKDERTFERDLVNALAEGTGPDLVVLPHDLLISERAKIWPISYEQYPLRTFKDTYIDGAEIFLLDDGVYALPIAVDPLMMYWNRSIFSTAGVAAPPKTWEDLVARTTPAIVVRDFSYNISRAVVAFGEHANVRNAKEVMLALLMQAGSNLIVPRADRLSVELNEGLASGIAPGEAALRFYTEFSNPTKTVYTWNRAMPEDRSAFLAEDLAIYFGFASEYAGIREGNPNFSFDATELPQNMAAQFKTGYGTFYGLALMRNSTNAEGAYRALFMLTSEAMTATYATRWDFAPVYRAAYDAVPQDPFVAAVYRAGLVARGWLDPDPVQSDNVFKQMIEDVSSGREPLNNAVSDAAGRLRLLVQ